MFERFTDASRRVVVLAQEEARMLGHGHIGTEHLLLGLLNEQSGIPAKVLESAGVTLDAARVQVAEIAGPGSKPPRGHIPFTPRAKRVLELSLREALELRQSNIRPEHVLLGLIRERNGVGAQVIERLGGPLPDLRQRVLDAAKDAPPDPVREEEHGPERSVWNWAPVRGPGPELQLTNESVFGFRHLLTSLDKRLSDIEQHLGIAAGERNRPGFRGLLLSVDSHLANIERHLGIPSQPHAPEDPDEPEAEAD
jgi:ATP-dependent Clp protease ATP-binding subunit ClpA